MTHHQQQVSECYSLPRLIIYLDDIPETLLKKRYNHITNYISLQLIQQQK